MKSPSLTTAGLVVAGGILGSRILGFARNILLYGLLGRGEETDLYVDAFALPDYLYFLLAGGYLSITLVPILSARLAQGDRYGANQDFTVVLRMVAGGLLLFTALLLFSASALVEWIFPEVNDHSRLTGLVRIALVSQIFFGVGALFAAAQYAQRRFLFPSLAPVIYNLGIIGGGLLGAIFGQASPEAFLWGGLFGAGLGNFALQWWGAHRVGVRLLPRVSWRCPVVGEYFALAFPLMLGQSVVALDEQWPRLFGQAVAEGATAGLHAARQLNMVPVGVIAVAAGVAAYPFLARLFAQQRQAEFNRMVIGSVHTALVPAALATALLLPLALPITRMVYQWGNFGVADTEVVAPLLWWYAISIPCWAAHQIYTRAFYAERQMWVPVGIGSSLTVLTLLSLWWTAFSYGAVGIAATSTLSILAYTLILAGVWHHRHPGVPWGSLLWQLGVASATTGIGVGSVTLLMRWWGVGAASPWQLVVGIPVGLTIYLGWIRFWDLPRFWDRTALSSESDRLSPGTPV